MPKDVDLTKKTITVNKSLVTENNRPEIKLSPKSMAGYRTIPIPDVLFDVLKQYIPTVSGLYLFPSASGCLMSDTAYRRFWEKIMRQLNAAMGGTEKIRVIPLDITAHMFRHTYATTLYYAGVDIKTAQYLLGHATAQMTMEIYTHLDSSKSQAAVDKLNDFISSSQKVVNRQRETR